MRASALEVQLTVHMTGLGRVTSEPAGIDCTNGTGMCNATFLADTSVNLTATPAAGYEPSQLASCFASTCTVSLGSAPQTIDAIFDVTSSLWLEVAGNGVVRATPLDVPPGTGEDGPMTCDIEGGTSPTPEFRDCQLRVAPGRRVLLELVRNVPGGTFIGWSDPDCPVQPTCTVVMPTAPSTPHDPVQPYDLTVAASFAPVPVGVIAAVVGGGHVSSTPAGMVCPPFVGDGNPMRCVGFFPPGEIVTLHAGNPSSVKWDPQTCDVVPTNPSDCTLVATTSVWVGLSLGTSELPFRSSDGPEVFVRFRVGKAGSGSGHVSGGGIDCGTNCIHDFVFGYLVKFTADPDPGSRFAGWRGGGCSDTTTSCTLAAGAATGLDATFEPDSALPSTPTPVPGSGDTPTAPTPPTPTPGANGAPGAAAVPTSHLLVRLTAVSSVRRGRQRALRVRITTATPVTATVTTRGPHSLVVRRTYHLDARATWLRVHCRYTRSSAATG